MGCFTKLILTGLGWAFGGPLGGIVGYALGSLFSSYRPSVMRSEVNEHFGNTEEKRDFNVTLLVLSAAVMKADGGVKKSELDYLKRFFLQNFGQERAENYIKMLREILDKEYNIYITNNLPNMKGMTIEERVGLYNELGVYVDMNDFLKPQ